MTDLTARSIDDLNILIFGAEPHVATAAMDELHSRALSERHARTESTATQLYPLSRIANFAAWELDAVLMFARDDVRNTGAVYFGMDRATTVRTAQRTIDDITAHQNYRAAMAFNRQATLDELHSQALREHIEREGDALRWGRTWIRG